MLVTFRPLADTSSCEFTAEALLGRPGAGIGSDRTLRRIRFRYALLDFHSVAELHFRRWSAHKGPSGRRWAHRAVDDFLPEIADDGIHRALRQLIYVRLIEAAVSNLTVAGRPREVSERQASQKHDECQNDD